MLTEQQCKLIEIALSDDVEPRKVAAYLCLHMGLTLAEISALRLRDIDLVRGVAAISFVMGKVEGTVGQEVQCVPSDMPRELPIPSHVQRYLREHIDIYLSGDCFIASGSTEAPAFYRMQNLLSSLRAKYKIEEPWSVSDLRNAFIRRCIQSGMDLYSICFYVGIKQPNVILKRFEEFFKPHFEDLDKLTRFTADYKKNEAVKQDIGPRRMNLLILGAGSQGPVVKEIAEAIGVFNEIAFLDDDANNKLAVGPLSDIDSLKDRFPMAIPSFGDSYLRERWMDNCEALGYIVPSLTHPSATVSPNATVDRSVVIEARCIVSTGAVIERGALVSSASVIEANAHVGRFVHIGSSVTVAKNAVVPDYLRISPGDVYKA